MKKIYTLLLIPIVFFFSCSCLDENEFGTSLADNNLKGDVQSVKHTIYNVSKKFGEIKPGSLCEKGYEHPLSFGFNYVLYEGYFEGSICKSTYDKNGMLLTKKWYDENKELCNEVSNTYNNGVLIESNETTIYKYIPNSNYKSTYWYNQTTGKKQKEIINHDTNIITRQFEYTDSTETITTDGSKYYLVTHFKDGRPTLRIRYDSVGNETCITNYNNHGFRISYSEKGESDLEYKYNEYFDPISLIEDIDTYTFTYEYDKKKNWIKRITFKGNDPIFIETREIIYFE